MNDAKQSLSLMKEVSKYKLVKENDLSFLVCPRNPNTSKLPLTGFSIQRSLSHGILKKDGFIPVSKKSLQNTVSK